VESKGYYRIFFVSVENFGRASKRTVNLEAESFLFVHVDFL